MLRTSSLAKILAGKGDSGVLETMNHHDADWSHWKSGLEDRMTDNHCDRTDRTMASAGGGGWQLQMALIVTPALSGIIPA
jgi:hypothetical protein